MMRKLLLATLLLAAAPAHADGYLGEGCPEDEPVYGERGWRPPPPRAPENQRPVPPCTPHGAITPWGDVVYPLKPGHIQAPPDMRKAFPQGIPPGWYR